MKLLVGAGSVPKTFSHSHSHSHSHTHTHTLPLPLPVARWTDQPTSARANCLSPLLPPSHTHTHTVPPRRRAPPCRCGFEGGGRWILLLLLRFTSSLRGVLCCAVGAKTVGQSSGVETEDGASELLCRVLGVGLLTHACGCNPTAEGRGGMGRYLRQDTRRRDDKEDSNAQEISVVALCWCAVFFCGFCRRCAASARCFALPG